MNKLREVLAIRKDTLCIKSIKKSMIAELHQIIKTLSKMHFKPHKHKASIPTPIIQQKPLKDKSE